MRFNSFCLLALLSVLAVLPADAKPSAKISKDLQTTLNAYAKAVRWNEFQLAAEMQDPRLVPDGFTEAQEAALRRLGGAWRSNCACCQTPTSAA